MFESFTFLILQFYQFVNLQLWVMSNIKVWYSLNIELILCYLVEELDFRLLYNNVCLMNVGQILIDLIS